MPRRIGRHAHPHAKADQAAPTVEPSGIDYLRLIEARHDNTTRRRIAYTNLAGDAAPVATDDDEETHR